MRLFGDENVGDWRKCNLHVSGRLGFASSYYLHAIGARLLGKTREEEELLLDHIRLTFVMGDRPQIEILGPHASMLRHVYTRDEVERMQLMLDETEEFCPGGVAQHEYGDQPICQLCGIHKNAKEPQRPARRLGFHFLYPIHVPVRQNISVEVAATNWLKEEVPIRVHLFGAEEEL